MIVTECLGLIGPHPFSGTDSMNEQNDRSALCAALLKVQVHYHTHPLGYEWFFLTSLCLLEHIISPDSVSSAVQPVRCASGRRSPRGSHIYALYAYPLSLCALSTCVLSSVAVSRGGRMNK